MSEQKQPTSSVKKTLVSTLVVPVAAGVVYGGYLLSHWVEAKDRPKGEQDVLDQKAMRTVDPALVKWKLAWEVQTGLPVLDGFAFLPDGSIAAVGGKTLAIIPAGGGKQVRVALRAEAKSVAVRQDGRIYVGLRDPGTMAVAYNAQGEMVDGCPAQGQATVITAIHAHGGYTYFADAGQKVVYKVNDLTGKLEQKLGQEDVEKHAPGLVLPSLHLDVAVGPDGLVWINNPGRHELEGFDAAGVMVRNWGVAGQTIEKFAGCCNPTDFAIFPDGRFVTAEKGVPRVKVYSSTGEFESVVVPPDAIGDDAGGMDVAVDKDGRVWVAMNKTGVIRVYEPAAPGGGSDKR